VSRAGRWRGLALVLLLVACRSRAASEPPKLERLTMTPHAAHRSAGQSQRFTVIGHYAGGTTKNLTQRVEYASSDPAVASAPNAKGDRSRVEAVAPGKATITATDRATGVSTHASGDDVTIVVVGGLERLTLTPEFVHRPLGQTQRLTATGYYPGGVTRNLTQHVVYSSSDPGIVAAPNAPGDKSRVETVGIGSATVSAVDPESGVSSSASGGDATVNVESPKIP
jgi:uncharacterized protein YjdB